MRIGRREHRVVLPFVASRTQSQVFGSKVLVGDE